MGLVSKIILFLAHLLFIFLCGYEIHKYIIDKVPLFPILIVIVILFVVIITFIIHTKTLIEDLKDKKKIMKEKKLKLLSELNSLSIETNNSLSNNSPILNGISCPECGEELMDNDPNVTLTTYPAQKNVKCSSCDYVGFRIL